MSHPVDALLEVAADIADGLDACSAVWRAAVDDDDPPACEPAVIDAGAHLLRRLVAAYANLFEAHAAAVVEVEALAAEIAALRQANSPSG